MYVSLTQFLKTGFFGRVHTGVPEASVRDMLGVPDNWAKSFRKARRPDILLYGGVEFWFGNADPARCRGIWIECTGNGWQDEFKMPERATIADWELRPYAPRSDVEGFLNFHAIPFAQAQPHRVGKRESVATREIVAPAGKVALCFDDNWQLIAFSARPGENQGERFGSQAIKKF